LGKQIYLCLIKINGGARYGGGMETTPQPFAQRMWISTPTAGVALLS